MEIREHVYLAALLHDIGKFYQRADKIFSDKTNELSENVKKNADYICPLNKEGNFGYQHAVWTLQFLTDVISVLKKIPDFITNNFDYNESKDNVFQLAAYHHKPSSELQALISIADWWSAGIDRRQSLEKDIDNTTNNNSINWGSQRYKSIPLYSVFNGINNGKGISAFDLSVLTIENESCFPHYIRQKTDGVSQEKYAKLWESFRNEFDKLPTDTFEVFAESLLYLLKKYTWCIPSNTTDMSDVSLFDHLKTTAAFADCLYMYKIEKPDDFIYENNRLIIKEGVKPVILLGGDLSGIQKFIYNIASRKASVSLKGRSFYLQLLIDSIIQRIIQHENIKATHAHIVYSSGGKFYMLLPNTDKVKNAIAELKSELEKELWKQHYGQLLINIDYVAFSYNIQYKGVDFENQTNQDIGLLWKNLADKLVNQKNKKFKKLLIDNYDEFFEVNEVSYDTKVCAVTGIESVNCKCLDKNDDEKTFVLPIVKEQAELGNTLKDIDYIVTYRSNTENKYMKNRVKIDVSTFGIHSYLFDQLELTDDDADFKKITSADTCMIKRINNTDYLGIPLKGKSCSYGFSFYGGNKQAQIENRDKTFEELAGNGYLGILKMDVDNLGSIFINGMPPKDQSFSAYSTLSFMLDYFFSGYLNTIRNNYNNDVNILYSGGDDVFAIGKWDKLIMFAKDIRKNFEDFVGRNDISISAGIVFVGNKFPIAKAAELAGEAEHAAKKFNNGKKNSINIFGENVSWENEFEYVENYKKQFVEHVENNNMSKSILHKIMTYAMIIKDNAIKRQHKESEDNSYIWNTVYYLTRFLKRYENNKNVAAFCKDLRDNQLLKTRNYELMAVAARWAELELKE